MAHSNDESARQIMGAAARTTLHYLGLAAIVCATLVCVLFVFAFVTSAMA